MTPDDLDRLEALAAAATPGPWAWEATGPGEGDIALGGAADPVGEFHIMAPHVCESCAKRGARCLGPSDADAAYIATLDPATVQQLIAAARLGAAWQVAEAALQEARDAGFGGGFPLSVTANAPLAEGYEAAASMTEAGGPTPAAALLSLAEALRARGT